jgi:hypothetical protein
MIIAIIVFALSLAGIAALFALKHWETRRGSILVPEWRARADVQAEKLKELAAAAWMDLGKVPPEALRVARIMVHEAALGFAALARFSERQAHRLADMVSHKRGFERRETRSEFLRKVAEHKNGNSSDLGENRNL